MNLSNGNGSDDTIFSNQEQIYDFYETLRNSSGDSVDQFQSILEVFVCDVLKYRKEIKRLEDSYKREKETNDKFLLDIEAEQDRDMRQLEEKVRQEERQKYDIERELLQQRTTKEINELQSNLQRLKTIEQLHTTRKTNEDSSSVVLREEIGKLIEENQTLHSNLNDSLTTNAILQTELLTFRSKLNERQTELLQEKQSSSSNHRDKESLQTNVRQLLEVNKQLRDENDSLRAVIETNQSNNNNNNNLSHPLLSPKGMASTPGSALGFYWNEQKLDNPSPSYMNRSNVYTFDSFDPKSTDEKGINNNGLRSRDNLNPNVQPSKTLPSATPFTLSNTIKDNHTNDSGLSITTVRDMTEAESDPEAKANKQLATLESIKQHRLLAGVKNNDETDSDDVFAKFPLDRTLPKRASRRGQKRGGKASPLVTRSSKMLGTDGSTMVDLQNNLSFDNMFKVVFCGDAAVGKSTLIMRLCKGKFVSSAQSTLGVDYQNKQIDVDGKRVAVQLWDTAGQERFRSVTKSFFRRCDGVILVYDATCERSFLNVREWINLITDSTSKKVSVMIVANKIDLRDEVRDEGNRVIETNEGAKLAKEHHALFIETSAKDGTNSNETLIELARDMQSNEDLERKNPTGIDLKTAEKKTVCCGN